MGVGAETGARSLQATDAQSRRRLGRGWDRLSEPLGASPAHRLASDPWAPDGERGVSAGEAPGVCSSVPAAPGMLCRADSEPLGEWEQLSALWGETGWAGGPGKEQDLCRMGQRLPESINAGDFPEALPKASSRICPPEPRTGEASG